MFAGPRAFVAFRSPPTQLDPMYHLPLGDLVYGDMSDGSADDDSDPDYGFDNDVFGEEEDELAMYAIAGMGGGGDDVWDFMDLPDVQSWYFHGD